MTLFSWLASDTGRGESARREQHPALKCKERVQHKQTVSGVRGRQAWAQLGCGERAGGRAQGRAQADRTDFKEEKETQETLYSSIKG